MNIIQITEKFPTELHCVMHLEKIRWGKKPKCAYCNSNQLGNRSKDNRFTCKTCGKTSSVTVNTALHNTRLLLKTWFYAFSIVTDAKKGLSAMQLQRNLNISYPTAWAMYHKIRELIIIENKTIELSGVVEMDETYIGGKPRPFNDGTTKPYRNKTVIPELDKRIKELKEVGVSLKRGRGNPAKSDISPKRGRGTEKAKVVGMVERDGNVIAQVMSSVKHQDLKKLVQKYVDKEDSVLITDEYTGYNK